MIVYEPYQSIVAEGFTTNHNLGFSVRNFPLKPIGLTIAAPLFSSNGIVRNELNIVIKHLNIGSLIADHKSSRVAFLVLYYAVTNAANLAANPDIWNVVNYYYFAIWVSTVTISSHGENSLSIFFLVWFSSSRPSNDDDASTN